MLIRFLLGVLLIGLGFVPAIAQMPPPSDFSIMSLRAEAAEAENKYMMAVLNRVNDHDKDKDDYWAKYVKGLDKNVDEP